MVERKKTEREILEIEKASVLIALKQAYIDQDESKVRDLRRKVSKINGKLFPCK